MKNIGTSIKEIRTIRKISALELSKNLGISAAAVSKWENAVSTPRYSIIPEIAAALNVPDSLLLNWIYDSSISENELNALCEAYQNAETLTLTSIFNYLYKDDKTMGNLYQAFDELNNNGQQVAVNLVKALGTIEEYKRID